MNPYAQLFSSRGEFAIGAMLVLIWLIVAGFYFRGRDWDRQRQMGPYFLYCLQAMAWLCGAIAGVFAVGFLLAGWKSSLWMIWELLYALAVICTFRLLPVLWLLFAPAMFFTRRRNFTAIRFSVISLVLLFLDAALYFLIEMMLFRHMVG